MNVWRWINKHCKQPDNESDKLQRENRRRASCGQISVEQEEVIFYTPPANSTGNKEEKTYILTDAIFYANDNVYDSTGSRVGITQEYKL